MKDSSKMLLEGIEVGGCGQERMGGEKLEAESVSKKSLSYKHFQKFSSV